MTRAIGCDTIGATLHSCKVTRPIRNAHNQPESFRRRPTTVSLIRLVEFKIISPSWIFDARRQQPHATRIFVTQDFLATVIVEIFVHDLISCKLILYFRLKVRNLVACENHAHMPVYATPPSLYGNL